MAGVPLKQQYGPTLGQLLAPWWHQRTRWAQILLIVVVAGLLAGLIGLVLRIQPAEYSHSGKVSFSFKYKGLYSERPTDGSYVDVQRYEDGELEDSFEVAPLRLPAYGGSVTAVWPIYAAGYAQRLRARYGPSFQVDGDGKTKVITIPGYDLFFSVVIDGREMFGRDVFLVPEREGAREGVVIQMLTYSKANRDVTSPTLVAGAGVLKEPLESFAFE